MSKIACNQKVRRNGNGINIRAREQRIRVVSLLHPHKNRIVSRSKRVRVSALKRDHARAIEGIARHHIGCPVTIKIRRGQGPRLRGAILQSGRPPVDLLGS